MQEYVDLGCPRHKLLMGIPTYGRTSGLQNPDNHDIGDNTNWNAGAQGEYTNEAGALAYFEVS